MFDQRLGPVFDLAAHASSPVLGVAVGSPPGAAVFGLRVRTDFSPSSAATAFAVRCAARVFPASGTVVPAAAFARGLRFAALQCPRPSRQARAQRRKAALVTGETGEAGSGGAALAAEAGAASPAARGVAGVARGAAGGTAESGGLGSAARSAPARRQVPFRPAAASSTGVSGRVERWRSALISLPICRSGFIASRSVLAGLRLRASLIVFADVVEIASRRASSN